MNREPSKIALAASHMQMEAIALPLILALAGLAPAAQARTLFGSDLKAPIFPQNGTLKVYNQRTTKSRLPSSRTCCTTRSGRPALLTPALVRAKMAGYDAT